MDRVTSKGKRGEAKDETPFWHSSSVGVWTVSANWILNKEIHKMSENLNFCDLCLSYNWTYEIIIAQINSLFSPRFGIQILNYCHNLQYLYRAIFLKSGQFWITNTRGTEDLRSRDSEAFVSRYAYTLKVLYRIILYKGSHGRWTWEVRAI